MTTQQDIKHLMAENVRLTSELHVVRTKLRDAIIEHTGFKEGDIVIVTTIGKRMTSEKRLVGRISKVRVNLDRADVDYEVSPKTKNGFHTRNTVFVGYGDRLDHYIEE